MELKHDGMVWAYCCFLGFTQGLVNTHGIGLFLKMDNLFLKTTITMLYDNIYFLEVYTIYNIFSIQICSLKKIKKYFCCIIAKSMKYYTIMTKSKENTESDQYRQVHFTITPNFFGKLYMVS